MSNHNPTAQERPSFFAKESSIAGPGFNHWMVPPAALAVHLCIGQASVMIQESFKGSVTAAAAAGFVGLLSLFNMGGRFVWASASDMLGRKNTYFLFFAVGAILYFAVKFEESRKKYLEEGLRPAVAALRAANVQLAMALMQGQMSQHYAPLMQNIDALIKSQLDRAKNDFERTQSRYVFIRNISVVAIVFGVFLAGLIGLWLIQAISRPLEKAVLCF